MCLALPRDAEIMDWDLTSQIAATRSKKQLHAVCCSNCSPGAPLQLITVKLMKYRIKSEWKWKLQISVYAENWFLFMQPQVSLPPQVLQFSCYFSNKLNLGSALQDAPPQQRRSHAACQQPREGGFSQPGRRAVVQKSAPSEKRRNWKITPEEDTNNRHPADSRAQREMPSHNRKMYKAH